MSKKNKLGERLANFASDKNWTAAEVELLLAHHGFARRPGAGSHTNFSHPSLPDVLTIAAHGSTIKPCYVRMIRQAIQDLKT